MYLNKYLWKYKYSILTGVVLVFLNNLFSAFVAPLTAKVFDVISNYVTAYSGETNAELKQNLYHKFETELLKLCALIIGTSIVGAVFLYYQRMVLIGMSRHIEYDLKNEIYTHYQSLPMSFYKKNNTGDIMNRISEDVSQVRQYLGPCIMYALNMVAVFSVSIPMMLSVNTRLTLFTLMPLPLLVASIYIVHNRISRQSENIQKRQSALSTFVQEAFSGIRVLKSYAKEEVSLAQFKVQSQHYKKASIQLTLTNSLFHPLIMLLIGASNIFILYIGGSEAIEGSITVGSIASFIIYLNRMSWPVASLGWISSLVQRAEVSQKRINEFLNTQSEILSGTYVPEEIKGYIRFQNVSFTYPDTGIKALKNISFEVQAGTTLAIIGNTGSGKSTLAALLCRLYDPDTGTIFIDNVSLKEYDLNVYRNNIGYVPQDVFLFSDTIRSNIAFGRDYASVEDVERAAHLADLASTINQLSDGYDTVIGERGITLSGGQKQRLSLARALIRNPRILILDDCLSAVDTQTEDTILTNLSQNVKFKTTIIISHRVSSVRLADKILVIDDGKVVEEGTHEQLMQKGGIYKEIYERQNKEDTPV
ncbi:MAG: ABC transporter ATP-binding protein/permease [Cytophagaceae bacterium]|nr:ABC transporter ATP-binding protein/permease [Cytophagaceae bacterium]MDW8455873.1 ABC transporter ATP-binding protein [Cytophagaceae bacterium]